MEIPAGLIEAAQAMGATHRQIIRKVMLPEAPPGILNAIVITLVAPGELLSNGRCHRWWWFGDVGIRYGYQRLDPAIMLITVAILVILVQLIQSIGERLVKRVDHR